MQLGSKPNLTLPNLANPIVTSPNLANPILTSPNLTKLYLSSPIKPNQTYLNLQNLPIASMQLSG